MEQPRHKLVVTALTIQYTHGPNLNSNTGIPSAVIGGGVATAG